MTPKNKVKNTSVRVDFAGAVLDGVIFKGKAYVALRPIVEGMGLSWARQLQRTQADPVLGSNCALMCTVAEDGKQREMFCIPENLLQGWLFSVNANRVKPTIRSKVIHYQRECYEVLHQAFTVGKTDAKSRGAAIDNKRAAAQLLTDVLKDALLDAGKTPKSYDFSNEHLLNNWALTGVFAALDESSLSKEQLKHLRLIRHKDAVFIMRGLNYTQRKSALKRYAESLRTPARLAA